jgi:2-polyprenyl-3-methyl-5-hydroxy-6-metoxy-1,4-benzoquinol methylase
MTSVQEHYQNLLAPHYAWICGGFNLNLKKNRAFFIEHGIKPLNSGIAVDLGAGCGFQSIPLAEIGFNVTAIDLSPALLAHLKKNAVGLKIATIQDDLLNFTEHCPARAEIITCMGDTLTHLNSFGDVKKLIEAVYLGLEPGGLLVLGFRDMTVELKGLDRFIAVRSGAKRIFTCFLEFGKNHVKVHDIVYEKNAEQWKLRKSVFKKLRISRQWTIDHLRKAGFTIESNCIKDDVVTILARK